MTSDAPELQTSQGVQERLGRLERQNRTLKLLVGAVLILLLVAQYRFEVRERKNQAERKNPAVMSCNRIVTNQLVLNGTDGLPRAWLSAANGEAILTLFGAKHEGFMELTATRLSLHQGGSQVVMIGGFKSAEPKLSLFGKDLSGIYLSATGEPKLEIADDAGFMSVIGSADLQTPRTGEAHKTSAASLVLFGKDGKVLWSAP